MTDFTKSFKEQEIVGRHEQPRPAGIRYIEKKIAINTAKIQMFLLPKMQTLLVQVNEDNIDNYRRLPIDSDVISSSDIIQIK